jgi:hypothetical protein
MGLTLFNIALYKERMDRFGNRFKTAATKSRKLAFGNLQASGQEKEGTITIPSSFLLARRRRTLTSPSASFVLLVYRKEQVDER